MEKIFYFFRNLYDWFHDKFYRVETGKRIRLQVHDNIFNFMYEPTPYHVLRKLFIKYPVCKDDHFIDFGCGKGRALVIAANIGCKNLYGLDISDSLLDVAAKNLSRYKKKCADFYLNLICMDAKKFVFNHNINKFF